MPRFPVVFSDRDTGLTVHFVKLNDSGSNVRVIDGVDRHILDCLLDGNPISFYCRIYATDCYFNVCGHYVPIFQ